eukprot:TRINITY_DN533_c0_g1_i7.p1 TRINITY_DN533_c0_g1~~TRINITY_DN533_c0_g1_i7.p1  ORF type:complete len:220 (-),score=101.18 TRINITY_DN533_c0_g1_i7:469-1083(-)
MLRSLVGSEMCIRDRYQRRVRGKLEERMELEGCLVDPDYFTTMVMEFNAHVELVVGQTVEIDGDLLAAAMEIQEAENQREAQARERTTRQVELFDEVKQLDAEYMSKVSSHILKGGMVTVSVEVDGFREETETRAQQVTDSWKGLEKRMREEEQKIKEGLAKLDRERRMADLMAQSLGAVLASEHNVIRPPTPQYAPGVPQFGL